MQNEALWLFGIFILMVLGAVIAFAYLVVKPLQTTWALRKARKIVASGKIDNQWQFNNVYRMLATARNDLEAAYLWKKLQELKDSIDSQKKV